MTLSQEQVRRIEKLAHLHLSDADREVYTEQLGHILDLIDTLNEVDTTKVEQEGIQYPHHMETRPDVVVEQETTREDLLGCSPQEIIGDQIAIPNIMK